MMDGYPSGTERLLREIASMDTGRVSLMEVCGTHTMAIAKSGLKTLLPDNIRLLSGPGCPVCVTPAEVLDAVLELAQRPDIVIATYGDMIRVPGSRKGVTLAALGSRGVRAEVVYSPVDGVEIAAAEPDRQIVFLGAGFETTAPGTAMAVKIADERKIKNFTVFSMLRLVEPALRALIADPVFNVNGFICPGHVATIIGEKGFRFLPDEYGLPAVISGFESEDILVSVYRLMRQIEEGRPGLENEYKRAVMPSGNPAAIAVMNVVFEPDSSLWRGLGQIPDSGLRIKDSFSSFDAQKRFGIEIKPSETRSPCRCGDVIKGQLRPEQCPLFGRACTPEDPEGPCMVSSEGACAAAYRYGDIWTDL